MTNKIVSVNELDSMSRVEQLIKASKGYRTEYHHSSSPLASGLKEDGSLQTFDAKKISQYVTAQKEYLMSITGIFGYIGDLYRNPEIIILSHVSGSKNVNFYKHEKIIDNLPEYLWKKVGILYLNKNDNASEALEYFSNAKFFNDSAQTDKVIKLAGVSSKPLSKGTPNRKIDENVEAIRNYLKD